MFIQLLMSLGRVFWAISALVPYCDILLPDRIRVLLSDKQKTGL
jgi:hypothetical protein